MTKPDATTVVDALLKTRLFSLAKMRLEGYYRPVQYLENPGVNSAHHVVLLWVRFGEPKRNAAVTSILPIWLNADQWELIDPIPDHHPLVRAAISDLVNNPYRKEDDDRSTSGSAG